MTEDILFKIIVPFIAALLGAFLAFRYQYKIELKREKRQVLQVLMMYRNVGANELDFIKMLNATDVVYHDNNQVRDLLHTYFAQTVRPLYETGAYVETFYRLVFAMAQDCGYSHLTMHDIRDFYSPEALEIHYPNRNAATVPATPVAAPDVPPNP